MSQEQIIEKPEEQSADLKSLIEKNVQLSELIYEQNKKIKHRLTMMVIAKYIWIIIVVAPIIISLFYLPSLYKQFMSQYSSILGGISQGGSASGGVDINSAISGLSKEQINGVLKLLQK